MKMKLLILSLFTIFSLILSDEIQSNEIQPVVQIGISNFVELVKNDNHAWVIGVIKSSDSESQKFLRLIEDTANSDFNLVKFGIVDIESEDGKKLFEGVELKLPASILFDDRNDSWLVVTDEKVVPIYEIKTLIEYHTKDAPKDVYGRCMKRDKKEEKKEEKKDDL